MEKFFCIATIALGLGNMPAFAWQTGPGEVSDSLVEEEPVFANTLKDLVVSGQSNLDLVDGEEVVKATPFSVQLDDSGSPVMRKGKIAGGAQKGRVRHFREMSDLKRAGEIEGVAIDPVNDDMLVLNNRGTQIVLGMSQGPLADEGYTGEVHEVYIYERIR